MFLSQNAYCDAICILQHNTFVPDFQLCVLWICESANLWSASIMSIIFGAKDPHILNLQKWRFVSKMIVCVSDKKSTPQTPFILYNTIKNTTLRWAVTFVIVPCCGQQQLDAVVVSMCPPQRHHHPPPPPLPCQCHFPLYVSARWLNIAARLNSAASASFAAANLVIETIRRNLDEFQGGADDDSEEL